MCSSDLAGFPPSRQGRRRAFLENLAGLPGSILLYEAPHRLEECLRDMAHTLGDRQIDVARELTKIYEEFIRGTVSQVLETITGEKVRGEVVIMVAPGEAIQANAEPLEEV